MTKLLAEWFWIDRWDGSSAPLLPMEAQGVYRAMLSQAWRRGARLPANTEEIRLLIRCRPAEWERSWPLVRRYWRVDRDELVNDTQLEIYTDALARSEGKASGGRSRASEASRDGSGKFLPGRRRDPARWSSAGPAESQPLSPSPSLSLTPTDPDPPSPSSSTSVDVPSSPREDDGVSGSPVRCRTTASAPRLGSVPAGGSVPEGSVPALQPYVSAIAAVFTAVPGSPSRPGPQDLKLMTEWHGRGIPLPVVVGSVQRAALSRSVGSTARVPIKSLGYFKAEVERSWQAARTVPPDAVQLELLSDRFAELAGSVRQENGA